MNSINMVFEKFEDIDLSFLGTPNLTQYDVKMNFSITEKEKTEECIYKIHINFDPSRKETPPGDNNFEGNCAPNDSQGDSTDGLPWHAHRRHWIRLPDEIVDATGLNHLSMEWVPCGRAPAGFRQARWDLTFYTVIPEYRAFMICDTFKTPSVCQYNQTSHLGRRMFTLPRLAQDPYFLANLPLDFSPDPESPEAFEYEGLTHYDPKLVPNTTANWTLPNFVMTTYDSAAVSWRAMIPHAYFSGKYWVRSSEYQYYVYQTMKGLPSNWTTFYDSSRMYVNILGNVLEGSASMCGGTLDPIKGENQNSTEIVFKDSSGSAKIRSSDMH